MLKSDLIDFIRQLKNYLPTRLYTLFCLVIIVSLIPGQWVSPEKVSAENTVVRRINVPYLGKAPPVEFFTPAIFWFGKVDQTSNYADVRAWYFDDVLKISIHIIDRRVWYNPNPTPADLTNWDAISLYFKLDGNNGTTPSSTTYRLDAQVDDLHNPRTSWQAGYQGNGTNWVPSGLSFTTESGYRWESTTEGGINNNQNDRGWTMDYIIPFANLGYSTKPATSTTWGFALVMHDRDDQIGTPILDQTWPVPMQPNQPSTWGQLHFGVPVYTHPVSSPAGMVTIRNGLNGAVVKDGEIGGHTTCSANLWPDIFTNFGLANYADYDQINIQNQWDLSDWSCFSKYYIDFPLNAIPAGNNSIISASLEMYLFGGSSGGADIPPASYIQVFTVDKDWNGATLNWNNAPLAIENISGTWVKPIATPEWVLYKWDVSQAVSQAYSSGQHLLLALYSADGNYHTGKYFISSYGQDVGRPTLRIVYGSSCGTPGSNCSSIYLPIARR
jgi:hypothetical protein